MLRLLRNVSFDTQKFVERLEAEGFTKQQAETAMHAFSDVTKECVEELKQNMVTKADHEKNVHMYKVDFTALRSEFKMQEKSEFNVLKSETERLATDLERAKQKMREEISKLQAGVRLDMSLEKGKMRDEAIVQEAKSRESDSKIETEVSNIRTQLESVKYDIVRNIIGIMTAAGGLILAYLRFMH